MPDMQPTDPTAPRKTDDPPRLYLRDWRRARGLSQQQCADAIGRDKSIWSKIESGKINLQTALIPAVEDVLGASYAALLTPPPDGTGPLAPGETGQIGRTRLAGDPAEALRRAGDAAAQGHPIQPGDIRAAQNLVNDRADLPVYASAQGGPEGMVMTYDPIEWVKRPEPLFNVPSGFGVYVVGDSMEPAYRQGDMILCHPSRPVNAGDDVLVVQRNGVDGQEYTALIKTLVRIDSNRITLKQYNPPEEFPVNRDGVHAVYLIVGKYNRR